MSYDISRGSYYFTLIVNVHTSTDGRPAIISMYSNYLINSQTKYTQFYVQFHAQFHIYIRLKHRHIFSRFQNSLSKTHTRILVNKQSINGSIE